MISCSTPEPGHEPIETPILARAVNVCRRVSALRCAVLAHVYRVLKPPPRVPDAHLSSLYLQDAKLKLSAVQRQNGSENAERLYVGADFDLLTSQIHATKAEISQGIFTKVR